MHEAASVRVGVVQPSPSCLVVRPFVVALPTVLSFVCPGAAPCAYSCAAHFRPCAQGRRGRCLLGFDVMSDFYFLFFIFWSMHYFHLFLHRDKNSIGQADCICPAHGHSKPFCHMHRLGTRPVRSRHGAFLAIESAPAGLPSLCLYMCLIIHAHQCWGLWRSRAHPSPSYPSPTHAPLTHPAPPPLFPTLPLTPLPRPAPLFAHPALRPMTTYPINIDIHIYR